MKTRTRKPSPKDLITTKLQKVGLLYEFHGYLDKRFGKGNWQKEQEFVKNRKLRADYIIQSEKIIIEINGGQWGKGRHTNSHIRNKKGQTDYEIDLEKSNLANMLGYRYLQFTYEMLMRKEYEQIFEMSQNN